MTKIDISHDRLNYIVVIPTECISCSSFPAFSRFYAKRWERLLTSAIGTLHLFLWSYIIIFTPLAEKEQIPLNYRRVLYSSAKTYFYIVVTVRVTSRDPIVSLQSNQNTLWDAALEASEANKHTMSAEFSVSAKSLNPTDNFPDVGEISWPFRAVERSISFPWFLMWKEEGLVHALYFYTQVWKVERWKGSLVYSLSIIQFLLAA